MFCTNCGKPNCSDVLCDDCKATLNKSDFVDFDEDEFLHPACKTAAEEAGTHFSSAQPKAATKDQNEKQAPKIITAFATAAFILSFIIFNLTVTLFPLSPEYFFSYDSYVVSLPIFVTHPALVFALISFFNAKAAKKEGCAVNKCVLPFCIVNFVAEGLYWLSVTAALIICSY